MQDIKRIKTRTGWLVMPNNNLRPAELSDQELYEKCREFGMNAKLWSRRFAALLPEVCRRNLHRRKGFLSIHELAAKLGGMSEYAVDRVLGLARKLEDKPVLRSLFESGIEGWSKIAKVAYVATVETDGLWAEKVKCLSQGALEVYVRNYRLESVLENKRENKAQTGQGAADGTNSMRAGNEKFYEPVRFSCPVDKTVEFDLRLAKQDLEKQTRQNLTWNETFGLLIRENKRVKDKKCPKCVTKKGVVAVCEACARRLGIEVRKYSVKKI